MEKFRSTIVEARGSLSDYARLTGNHELFGLDPPEREEPKSGAEKVREGKGAARRALRSIFGKG